jgi:4-amino-4-deoxy-L-arabinose transferase-like glycosyltransferase
VDVLQEEALRKGEKKGQNRRPPANPKARKSLSDWAGQNTRVVVALCVAVNLLLCLALFDPKLHTGGDSSSYVLLAESVLRVGDGYAQALEPGPPQVHTQYPPGYPLMLAPVVALAGRNFVLLKLLSVLLSAASVLLFALYARRRSGPREWLYLAAAFAVNPLVVDYSRWILSEAPFLFVTLLALYFLHQDQPGEMRRPFWGGLLAAAAAYYVRSVGVMLVAGASLAYLVRREWKKFFVHGVISASLTLPWLVRNKLLGGASTPYLDQFLLRSVYEPEAGYLSAWGMVGRFFTNVQIYSARELPRALVGSDSPWSVAVLIKGLAVVMCLFMLVGLVRTVRRKPEAAEIYFVLTCLAVLLFEEVVSDVRYLLPLVPLVLIYAAEGLSATVTFLRRTATPSRIPAIALVLLTGLGLFAQVGRIGGNADMLGRYMAGDRYAGYPPNWRTFFEAADWVHDNTPADAVFTVRKPRLFNVLADRRVLLYPFSTDTDSVLATVMASDYVVVDQISGTTFRYLVPALETDPTRFTEVLRTQEPPTWVLSVRK